MTGWKPSQSEPAKTSSVGAAPCHRRKVASAMTQHHRADPPRARTRLEWDFDASPRSQKCLVQCLCVLLPDVCFSQPHHFKHTCPHNQAPGHPAPEVARQSAEEKAAKNLENLVSETQSVRVNFCISLLRPLLSSPLQNANS